MALKASGSHLCPSGAGLLIAFSPPVESSLSILVCEGAPRSSGHSKCAVTRRLRLALPALPNTCQPQQENACDSQRRLPLLSSTPLPFPLVRPCGFALSRPVVPDVAVLSPLVLLTVFQTKTQCFLSRLNVSGFICDTFLLPGAQISQMMVWLAVNLEQVTVPNTENRPNHVI